MASRKDLLKAHTFVTQRMVAALVDRDPDDIEPPLRRVGTATFVGIMIAVIVMAGFGLVGLIRPGNSKNWKVDKTVIVDTGSGGVLVYLGDKLFPAYNITSARLAAGSGDNIKSVKSASLRDFPREHTIGIKKAPQQLPSGKDLRSYPIRVCSAPPAPTAKDRSRITTLEMGMPEVTAAPASVIARADGPDAKEYLIAEGTAYELVNHAVAIQLGFGEQQLRPGNAWLRTLPQGPPLRPLEVPGRGERSQNPVPGLDPSIGQLVHVEGTSQTYYVLTQGGLSEISPVESAVLEVSTGVRSRAISAAQANAARNQQEKYAGRPGMPHTMPTRTPLDNADSASLCATWTAPGRTPQLAVNAPVPGAAAQNPDPNLADAVIMGSLRGALIKNEGALGPGDPGVLIVDGLRYGIADNDAKNALGYGGITPTEVSPQLLRLIPEGLDPGESLSIKAALRMN